MKLKHFFTGMALLCFALSACGAKAETAEETTTAISGTEEQGEGKTEGQAAETLESALDNGNLADADASALSDETAATSTPPIYTDVESFVTTESNYFTDLGYEPDTEIKKYRAKLTISRRNDTADFDLLNVAKQWAKDRAFELKDLTTDNMVYGTALLSTKWYADDSCISIAFTTGGFGVRIEIAFFAADPEAVQFLADAKDIVSTFETPNSFDLEDESRLYDTGVSTNGAVPRAELKIAWNISSIADDNVNKAMELCRKWGEFFGIPMDNFKLEKRGSSLYQALAYVKKDESRYVVSCVVNLDEVQRAVASTRIIVDDLEQN